VSRLPELTAKIDAFFSRVEARHGGDMACQTGCSDCCHVRLTVTTVEAAAITAHLEALPADERATLARRAAGSPPDRCAALDALGRCQIYAARPVVCRSHGAPIRMREGGLPVIQSCYRNFTHTTPDADARPHPETLSAMVLAVDRAAGATGTEPRIDLASLLQTK